MMPISSPWIVYVYCAVTLLRPAVSSQPAELSPEQFLPKLLTFPPTRIYFDPQSVLPLQLSCTMWPPPPFGKISYHTAAMTIASPSFPAQLTAMPPDLLDSNSSIIMLSSAGSVLRLSPYNLHCLASTKYGSVLSAPFSVTTADFSTVTHHVSAQNVTRKSLAIVRCQTPRFVGNYHVQFLLNDRLLPTLPEKYLIIISPTIHDHLLLIRLFDATDEGVYHCVIHDSSSGRILWSDPQRFRLQLQADASRNFVFTGDFSQPHTTESPHSLYIHEAANVSLLCSSSAPYPVRIEKLGTPSSTAERIRFNALFGTIFIDQISTEDEGTYLCHIDNQTSSISLRIKPRPWIIVLPMSVQQKRFTSVDLTCLSSEPFPVIWHHNGQAVSSQQFVSSNSTLHIPNLTDASTGVYQCVQRNSDGGWTIATSYVTLDGLPMLHEATNPTADRDKRNAGTPTHFGAPVGSWTDEGGMSDLNESPDAWFHRPKLDQRFSARLPVASGISDFRLSKPLATTIGDNLAANITWPAVQAAYYLIQFRHKLPLDQRWSKPFVADGAIPECCAQIPSCCLQSRHFYFTNHQPDGLESGRRYQFRVQAFSSDSLLMDKSPWSPIVSFEHISKVAPVFTETERLHDGSTVARWTLATSAVGFPIDHFLLLYRMEDRQVNGRVTYSPFEHVFVPGADTREVKLNNLEPGKGYQLVVYGVHTPPGMDPLKLIFQGGYAGRKITQFSHEVFVKPQASSAVDSSKAADPSTPLDSIAVSRKAHRETNIIFNSTESNHLMFLILGALAGLLLVVILCLMVLCICRQVRKRNHLKCRFLNWLPGSKSSSKDPANDSNSRRRLGTFMLENLPNVANSANMMPSEVRPVGLQQHVGSHASVLYPYPPPGKPPPPPPRWVYSGSNIKMFDIGTPLPQPPFLGYHPAVPLNHGYPYSFVANTSIHNPMACSSYSAQTVGANFTGMGRDVLPMGVPSCEMKREPPSGGSVHDATDTETDAQDQVTHFPGPFVRTEPNANYPVCSVDVFSPHSKYTPLPTPSVALNAPAMVYSESLRSRDSNPPYPNYFINPMLPWQESYNPDPRTLSPPNTGLQRVVCLSAQQQANCTPCHHPNHLHEDNYMRALAHQKHQRRRSHHSAESFVQRQLGVNHGEFAEAAQPLMTSSPVARDQFKEWPQEGVLPSAEVVGAPPPIQPRTGCDFSANWHRGDGQPQYPPLTLAEPQWTAAVEHRNFEHPARFAMDRALPQPLGPLLYGNHNPGAAHSTGRRDSTHGMLIGSPPRVRDYSEYGILTPGVGNVLPNPQQLSRCIEQAQVPPSSALRSGDGTHNFTSKPMA